MNYTLKYLKYKEKYIKLKTEKRIDDIIKNVKIIFKNNDYDINNIDFDKFKYNILELNNNSEFNHKLKESLNNLLANDNDIIQDGGSDCNFTFMDIIDILMIPPAAVPILGIPASILSIVLALVRKEYKYALASLVTIIPIVGNIGGSIWKLVIKNNKLLKKIIPIKDNEEENYEENYEENNEENSI
jgi:hypothetical protein